MNNQLRRYALFLLLLLLSAGWVFVMNLDVAGGGSAPAADGVEAAVTWLNWKGAVFPRVETHVSVLDAAGEPVRGLMQDAFIVSEDDYPVTIQSFLGAGEQTVITMLVIDRSGSMSGDKIAGARNAANTFVDQMRPERDRAGLIIFDDSVQSLQPLTNDVDALRNSISGISVNGGTAFYDAVYQGLQRLVGEDGRRIILALTDGLDNASHHTPEEIMQLAQDEGIAIYTVGLGEEGWWVFTELDSENLRLMAEETGGEYHQTPSASELAALYGRIAEVVQNEYVLGYDSPSPNLDGTTRQVVVTVNRAAGSVVARGSYAVSGVLSSAFDAALFVPLFVGLLLLLLLLLFIPSGLRRWQRWRLMRRTAVHVPPPPYPSPTPASHFPPGGTQVIQANATPCPHCGQPVAMGKKFCSRCGQPVSPAPVPLSPMLPPLAPSILPVCRHCAKPLRSGIKFCSHCGKPQ